MSSGAQNGDRTRVLSLEGRCTTIVRLAHVPPRRAGLTWRIKMKKGGVVFLQLYFTPFPAKMQHFCSRISILSISVFLVSSLSFLSFYIYRVYHCISFIVSFSYRYNCTNSLIMQSSHSPLQKRPKLIKRF